MRASPFCYYFTHTSTSNITDDGSIKLSSSDFNSLTKSISLKVTVPKTNHFSDGLALEYKDFTRSLSVRSPVKADSAKSVRAKVNYSKYTIYSSLSNKSDQLRHIEYSNPLPSAGVKELFVNPPFSPEIVEGSSKYILKSLNEQGSLTWLTNVPIVNSKQDWAQPASLVATLRLPNNKRGFTPSSNLAISMDDTTPIDLTWGIFYLISENNVSDLVSLLKEIVYLGFKYQLIYKDEADNNQVKVNSADYWGFPEIIAANNISTVRDVCSNSMLGWALCEAIRFLQDKKPLNSIKLYGANDEFIESLLVLLKSLAYYSAGSVSPVSNWCASSSSVGNYSYELISYKASIATSLFLTEYVNIDSDTPLIYSAAKLYLSISDSTTKFKDIFYSRFVDYSATLSLSIHRLLWSSRFRQEDIDLLSTEYEAYYAESSSPTLMVTEDGYKLGISETEIWAESLTPVVDNYIQFLSFYLLNTFSNSVAQRVVDFETNLKTNLDKEYTSLEFSHLVLLKLGVDKVNIHQGEVYDLQADTARLLTTKALYELRRLWPYGMKWTEDSIENDVSSNIGSLLFASSEIFFGWYLGYLNLKKQGLFLSSLPYLNFHVSKPMAISHSFRTDWMRSYQTRLLVDQDTISYPINKIFGVQAAVDYPLVSGYNRYKDKLVNKYDYYTDEQYQYQAPVALTEEEYKSILLKNKYPKIGGGYKINQSVSLSKPIGVEFRKVPGFSYKRLTISDTSVLLNNSTVNLNSGININNAINQDDYLSDSVNINNRYVLDGGAVVYPLRDVAARVDIHIPIAAPDYLNELLQNIVPAGIKYTAHTNNIFFDTYDRIIDTPISSPPSPPPVYDH